MEVRILARVPSHPEVRPLRLDPGHLVLDTEGVCGRYALAGDWSDFTTEFELEEVPGLEPRYNIAPSYGPGFEAPVVILGREVVFARFWFIPAWWNEPLDKLPTSFNARSETAMHQAFFRGAARCLVPSSGWREFPGPRGKKRAQAFERRTLSGDGSDGDRALFFAFGGLFSEWQDGTTGERIRSFAILTAEPSDAVRPYHNRMPLLIARDEYRTWLDHEAPYDQVLAHATKESHSAFLTTYECSTFGNSTRNEGPECIAPAMTQPGLFD